MAAALIVIAIILGTVGALMPKEKPKKTDSLPENTNILSANVPLKMQTGNDWKFAPTFEPANNIVFYHENKMIVSISLTNANVTFGEGVTPEAASMVFWDHVKELVKEDIRK